MYTVGITVTVKREKPHNQKPIRRHALKHGINIYQNPGHFGSLCVKFQVFYIHTQMYLSSHTNRSSSFVTNFLTSCADLSASPFLPLFSFFFRKISWSCNKIKKDLIDISKPDSKLCLKLTCSSVQTFTEFTKSFTLSCWSMMWFKHWLSDNMMKRVLVF